MRSDRHSQLEPRAVTCGRLRHRARGRDRVGIAALWLVGGERDVVDVDRGFKAPQLRRFDHAGIDTDRAQHRDIRA